MFNERQREEILMLNGIEDWLNCPECGSGDVEFRGGYRENGVQCQRCGLKEGDLEPPDDWER